MDRLPRLWHLALDLLFPPRCVTCRTVGALWCARCQRAVQRFAPPRCPRCDQPMPTVQPRCDGCAQGAHAGLTALRAVGPHAAPLREAIHALKYERRSALAAPLARLMAERWAEAGSEVAGLLPVPLHPTRQRERGFNQAELLARGLGETLALPVRADLLQRQRATPSQVGLSRAERQRNVRGAFEAAPGVRGQAWLLVDDVCTTGATLTACAEALRVQGAREVWAITLARAGNHAPSNIAPANSPHGPLAG